MRSLEDSRTRWHKTMDRAASLADLKLAVRSQNDENPCVSGLRSICWKISLLFHSVNLSAWSAVLADSRSAYTSLREHFLKYVERPDELGSELDPLDDDKNLKSGKSPWNILRQDEELRAEIRQDVERCMPEDQYFRLPATQQILLDVLFIFCKMNQDVGYRQGMHELLAPILWVVESDALQDGSTSTEAEGVDYLIQDMLNPRYVEQDAFTLFALLMQSAKSFYELGEPEKSSSSSSGVASNQNGASPIIARSKRIHEDLLARLDPELADHLTAIEILPQIFLIRWIRILFGREFPFENLLSLWDTLFVEDPGLDLVDLICVTMLLRIRWKLIEADYSVALTLLLKYPFPEPPHGPQTFVDDAIYLKENFNAAGAAKVIKMYSGKVPGHYASPPQPGTPSGMSLSPEQKVLWRRSPLPSPARFLPHPGGVEGFLQGAAKGVFERGERLGINKAVRDAVGEVKKNMQNLQTPSPPLSRRSSDVLRWSRDEGRIVPSVRKSIALMDQRNKQLSQMVAEALNDLRDGSISEGEIKSKSVDAIDLAIAKLQFVQVYLEDSNMPLPPQPSQDLMGSNAKPSVRVGSKSAKVKQSDHHESRDAEPVNQDASLPDAASDSNTVAKVESKTPTQKSHADVTESSPTVLSEEELGLDAKHRPRAPIPTRSTLAQSSFAFMLEPDKSTISPSKAISSKTSSPFVTSGRRPLSGGGRENAFLFGGEADDSEQGTRKSSIQNSDEEINLETMKRGKGR